MWKYREKIIKIILFVIVLDVLNVSYNDHLQIKTAQRKDGLWTVGNSYQCLTGNCDDYGGGCGCWYDGATYKTEEDAILANLEWFKVRENNVPKIQNAINKAIFDRKCKQLTLF